MIIYEKKCNLRAWKFIQAILISFLSFAGLWIRLDMSVALEYHFACAVFTQTEENIITHMRPRRCVCMQCIGSLPMDGYTSEHDNVLIIEIFSCSRRE